MRKVSKCIFAILTAISVIFIMSNVCFAASDDSQFDITRFDNQGNEDIDGALQDVVKTAVNVIRIVGTAASIITLILLGIKYMTASPDGKAEFKKSLYIYIVGAVLVFAASNILAIIYKLAESF